MSKTAAPTMRSGYAAKRKLGSAIVYVILSAMVIIWLFPILWLVLQSFNTIDHISTTNFFPTRFTMKHYQTLFMDPSMPYGKWILNTFLVAVASCIISTLFVLMVSYTLSRLRFKSRKMLLNMGLILGMFPGFMSMAATYAIMDVFGLASQLFALIIIYSAGAGLGYQVAKGFFDTIPRSLDEAARIDGATSNRIFWVIILLVLLFALVACEVDYESLVFQQFQKFIKKYHKKYESMNEYLARFNVFKHNLLQTLQNGEQNHRTGITKFFDLTQQEFAKTYLNLEFPATALLNLYPAHAKHANASPDAFDWRDKGVVSAVKDQGSCGSCWAFSTVGNLEGLYALEKGVVKTFSEQLLVDCDTSDSGCNGGLMELTFAWLKKNGGFMTDTDYPYTGRKSTCKQDKTKYVDMTVTGYVKLGDSTSTWSPVDEDEVRDFLVETGPLAIALNANPLQTYTGGILDLTKSQCNPDGMNHAVTLVGYGTDEKSGLDFWIVKNSWGKSWGESGYFRIARGKGTCGINQYITTATVAF